MNARAWLEERLAARRCRPAEDAARLAEGALLGTEPRRAIWTDADYLVAILATLTGDGDRARTAALSAASRRVER